MNKGFTLIETLIYAVLLTAITAVAILATYQIIEAQGRGKDLEELADSQRLLEQKIYWALQSNSAINSPGSGATSTILSVNKLNYSNNPVVIDSDSGVARIRRGAGSAYPITNDARVEVSDLNFHQHNFSGQPAIKVSGTLINIAASTSIEIDTLIFLK